MGGVVRCWGAEFVRAEASDAEFVCGGGVRPAAPNGVQRKFGLVGAIAQTRMVSSWQLWASAGWTGRLVGNLSDCVLGINPENKPIVSTSIRRCLTD